MHIIFISSTCTRADYEMICKRRKLPMLDSSQKFFEMLLNGLNQLDDVSVDCITVPPISHSTYPGVYTRIPDIQSGNITYHYIPVWNLPIVKSVISIFSVNRQIKKIFRKRARKDVKIICDPLLLEGLLPTVGLGKKDNVTTIGFLTDMPDCLDECNKRIGWKNVLYRVYNKMVKKNLLRLDRYIVLTEAMSCITGQKPRMLLDCIVDESMLRDIHPEIHEDNLPHILYAGKLHKEFGLQLLCEAIPLIKSECVVDLYGTGNYLKEIERLSHNDSRVRLHGVVPLGSVLSAELSASVLVNPRTSAGEYTKYSFPSKTAEYMLAGVPVVMFRLPGISSQYDNYICYAEKETPDSLALRIDQVLSMQKEQRYEIGKAAKHYVLESKNNKIQSKRIIEFISR